MKWGMQAFDTFGVVPPGFGIVHQVNLEYLARGVHKRRRQGEPPVYYPDSLVGTDSHTTMINGIGVVGWGVGGIEAEAGDARPAGLLPDARRGRLRAHRARCAKASPPPTWCSPSPRSCAARRWSASSSSSSAKAPQRWRVPDRATIGNMAPEYGATMGFFPVDEKTIEYFRGHRPHRGARSRPSRPTSGRRACSACRAPGEIDYTQVVKLDLGTVTPSLAGPKRPQDRIELGNVDEPVRRAVQQADRRERLQPAGRAAADAPPGARRDAARRRRAARCPQRRRRRPARRARSMEMEANKPTLAAAQSRAPRRRSRAPAT